MNEENTQLASLLVDGSYIRMGAQSLQSHSNLLKHLLTHRSMPDNPWPDALIEHVLAEIALMDSNNFIGVHVGLVRFVLVCMCVCVFSCVCVCMCWIHCHGSCTCPCYARAFAE